MKHSNLLHRQNLKTSDVKFITVSARQIKAVFRYLFRYRARKRQQKTNVEIENTRLKHVASMHRIAKDRWRG